MKDLTTKVPTLSNLEINQANFEFWNELCGTIMWKSLKLGKPTPENLAIFDRHYFDYYPYLRQYITPKNLSKKKVLEIGLGFGTVGEFLFKNCKQYLGLDNSASPVDMMLKRISNHSKQNTASAVVGDAKDLLFGDNTFDFIVSIGCLHHTGNLEKCIDEVYRVLKPGGATLIMVYHSDSFRRKIINPFRFSIRKLLNSSQYSNYQEYERATYDASSSGEAAPETVYSSKQEIENYFKKFNKLTINIENLDDFTILSSFVNIRKYLLNNLAKSHGLDLYIQAVK